MIYSVGRGHDPTDPPPKTERKNQPYKDSNRVGGVMTPPYEPLSRKYWAGAFVYYALECRNNAAGGEQRRGTAVSGEILGKRRMAGGEAGWGHMGHESVFGEKSMGEPAFTPEIQKAVF